MASSSTLINTARRYTEAIASVDPEALRAVTTDSYTATLGPESSGFPGSITRDQLIAQFAWLSNYAGDFDFNIKQTWVNEAASQVTFWATCTAQFKPAIIADDDPSDWVWKTEYVFLFTLDPTGERVEHLFEFGDSKSAAKWMELMGKIAARAGGP